MKKSSEKRGRAAAKMGRTAAQLARQVAAAQRAEEDRARAIAEQLGQAEQPRATEAAAGGPPAPDTSPAGDAQAEPAIEPAHRRAMLILNTKSGPKRDSIVRVRELVDLLAAHGIAADVRVKLRKRVARKDARAAAKAGYPLVIAAGGDGTVAAVARGLADTQATLGIIPLGTYNNIATSLGIPAEAAQACALLASGATRPVDVGRVEARGRKKPRPFLEMAGVGLMGALMPVGQDVEKGRWESAGQALPAALQMEPTEVVVTLDGAQPPRRARSLLVEIANAPRMGAGLVATPEARMDDGLLDVAIYEDMGQASLAARFVALKAGLTPDDTAVQRARAQRIEIRTATPFPVVADSKVIGTTPATFTVQPGALRVIVGHGSGLVHPAAEALVEATTQLAAPVAEQVAQAQAQHDSTPPVLPTNGPPGPLAAAAGAVTPVAGRALHALGRARALALPAAAVAGAAAGPLLRLLTQRRRR